MIAQLPWGMHICQTKVYKNSIIPCKNVGILKSEVCFVLFLQFLQPFCFLDFQAFIFLNIYSF